MALTLTSSAFKTQGIIPEQYTCDSDDISPPLNWTGIPDKTKSLALIVDDPDAPDPKAPKMTYVHWILYNIPPSINRLEEALDSQNLPQGILEGTNDWHRTGYGGPCPPIGEHRYFFKLYALDTVLPDLKSPTKDKLLEHMSQHILGQAELMGVYTLGKNKQKKSGQG